MPAALTVDPRLVDDYLARVDRFVNNVSLFEQQLMNTMNMVKERFAPEQKAEPIRQEPVATKPTQAVVTADDIDIDALLSGVSIDGMTL